MSFSGMESRPDNCNIRAENSTHLKLSLIKHQEKVFKSVSGISSDINLFAYHTNGHNIISRCGRNHFGPMAFSECSGISQQFRQI